MNNIPKLYHGTHNVCTLNKHYISNITNLYADVHHTHTLIIVVIEIDIIVNITHLYRGPHNIRTLNEHCT